MKNRTKVIVQRKVVKAAKNQAPDLKAATAAMLGRVAGWMDTKSAEMTLFASTSAGTSPAEWVVLEEARALAIEYVRSGARL